MLGVRQKSSVFKGTAKGTGRANSLPSQRDGDPRVPGGSAPPPIHAPRPSRLGSRAIFAVSVRVQNFQKSYLLLPTPTLVKKSSKVLPTVTYCDFGPPSLCFRLLIASAFASLSFRNAAARPDGATSGKPCRNSRWAMMTCSKNHQKHPLPC